MFLGRVRFRPLRAGLVLVFLSAFYLALPARDLMDWSTACAVAVHTVLGLALAVPALWALWRAIGGAAPARAGTLRALVVVGVVCAATGCYLAVLACTGRSVAREAIAGGVHIGAGCAVVALFALHWWLGRRRSTGNAFDRTEANSEEGRPEAGSASASSSVPGTANAAVNRFDRPPLQVSPPTLLLSLSGLLLLPGGLFGAAALLPEYRAADYYRDLTATNAEQAANPYFPAGIRIAFDREMERGSPLPPTLPRAEQCGSAGCHADANRFWHASAHRASGDDPYYRAAAADLARKAPQEQALWCEGCHAPRAALIARAPYTTKATIQDARSQGVDCYVCHGATGEPTRTGDGRLVLAPPQDYPFGDSSGWKRQMHDFLLRVRPGPHQRAYLRPQLTEGAEFCSGCHRQSLSVAQNHFQFMRGPDEYGEWVRGPYSGRSARAGGGGAKTCRDCHFAAAGPAGHLAPGGLTALAALRSPEAAARDEAMLARAVTVDLFSLRPAGSRGGGDARIAALGEGAAETALGPGDECLLDVAVRNQGCGHDFPAGYPDLVEAWVELTVQNDAGQTVLSSGVVREPGAGLPPDTHAYGSLALDRDGRPIIRHLLADRAATAYRRTIPPGGADVARFRFTIPRTGHGGGKTGPLRITARVRYRSMRPDFAALAARASARDGAPVPAAPPVTTLAESYVLVRLGSKATAVDAGPSAALDSTVERLLAYGRALVAPPERPDIGAAVAAFREAARLAPNRAEAWLDLGRAYLREPDLRLASSCFERALACAPDNAAAKAELAVVYSRQGQPERSIADLTRLTVRFPYDAALRYDYGIALFRKGEYREAAAQFGAALALDPDNSAAHFELKRCYDSLRRVTDARREDSITRYMADDPTAPQIVQRFLNTNREAARRAEPFPEHRLMPVRTGRNSGAPKPSPKGEVSWR